MRKYWSITVLCEIGRITNTNALDTTIDHEILWLTFLGKSEGRNVWQASVCRYVRLSFFPQAPGQLKITGSLLPVLGSLTGILKGPVNGKEGFDDEAY